MVAVVLLTAACSSDADSAATTTTTAATTPTTATAGTSPSAGPVGDFCTDAARFVDDRSVTDISRFSEEFFADVDQRLSTMVNGAPPAIRGEVEILRAGFDGMDQALADFDYDLEDPGLPAALAQVDNEAMLAATAAVEQYLIDGCGAAAGVTDPRQVADIQEAFGVDQATAECLNRELGDIANIDSGQLTPELMGRAVCGTSLIALLAGTPPEG